MKIENILDKYIREGTLKKFLFSFIKDKHLDKDLLDDFIQELCLILLEYKDKHKLVKMYYTKKGTSNELDSFIMEIINRQLKSNNSPFYYKYKKWNLNKTSLNDYTL